MHTQSVFRIIFKKRVRPSGTLSVCICCIRHRRGTGTVDRRATCCVGNKHSVTEKLCHKMDIRCFSAACTSSGKFKIGRFEHSTANGFFFDRILFPRDCHGIVPKFLFFQLGFNGFHDKCFISGRADIGTNSAAVAVFLGNNNAEFQTFHRPLEILYDKSFRSFCGFFFRGENGTDGSMRT